MYVIDWKTTSKRPIDELRRRTSPDSAAAAIRIPPRKLDCPSITDVPAQAQEIGAGAGCRFTPASRHVGRMDI
jgi:hypothetical protein